MDGRDITAKVKKEFPDKIDTHGKGAFTIESTQLPNKVACDVMYKEYNAETTYYPMVRITSESGRLNLRCFDGLKYTNSTCSIDEMIDALIGAFVLMKILHQDEEENV